MSQYFVVQFGFGATTFVKALFGPFDTLGQAEVYGYDLTGASERNEYGNYCNDDGEPLFSVKKSDLPK